MFNIKDDLMKKIYLFIAGIIINFTICLMFICVNLFAIRMERHVLAAFTVVLTCSVAMQINILMNMKKLAGELKENQETYKQILESLPNAVLVHKKLKFTFANTKGAEFFNVKKPEDLIGKSLEDFIRLNTDAIGQERLNNAMNEKEFSPLTEKKITRVNGEVVDMEVFSNPILVNGKVSVLNIIKDITEQKKLQKLEKEIDEEQKKRKEAMEMDRLKGEFFANLSHELKTPLTIIFSVVQLIERNLESTVETDDSMKRYLKVLRQNCYRLLKLINNLIDMTRIDSGHFSMELQNHDIISIVENTTLSVVEHAENKGIEIQFDTDVEEKTIACNPDKIERIILNLLSNAIKFTDCGGNIKVNVFDQGDAVEIVVKDTGVGIPQNKIDMIFERFVQVDKSFTRNHEGSGIGLSIVKELVKMHDGTIWAESEYGMGSTFTVKLPVKLLPEDVQSISNEDMEDIRSQKVNIEFSDIYC